MYLDWLSAFLLFIKSLWKWSNNIIHHCHSHYSHGVDSAIHLSENHFQNYLFIVSVLGVDGCQSPKITSDWIHLCTLHWVQNELSKWFQCFTGWERHFDIKKHSKHIFGRNPEIPDSLTRTQDVSKCIRLSMISTDLYPHSQQPWSQTLHTHMQLFSPRDTAIIDTNNTVIASQ